MTNYHLILDASGGDQKRLWDTSEVKDLLKTLPASINMNTLSRPKVIEDRKGDAKEQGITGFIILDESHISIHTYPNKSKLFLDVFSCRKIDKDVVIEEMRKRFDVKRIKAKMLKRE
jgi:S-adenosylmethionine decarboxylase